MTANLASPISQQGGSPDRRPQLQVVYSSDEKIPAPRPRERMTTTAYVDRTFEGIIAVGGVLATSVIVGGAYLINKRLRR